MNPALYHAHHNTYTDDLPFWLALAERQSGSILELGVGTGRVMLPLLEAGHSVVGMDNDGEMLDFLRKTVSNNWSTQAKLVQADIIDFELDKQFDLALLPCNTYSTLDDMQRASALTCIHKHVNSAGQFALSLPNPYALAALPEEGAEEIEDTFTLAETLTSVQVSSAWQRGENGVTLFWHYDLLQPDGNVKRQTASVSQHIVEVNVIESEFEEAGFSVEACYGDFDRSEFDEDSPNLIYILSVK